MKKGGFIDCRGNNSDDTTLGNLKVILNYTFAGPNHKSKM
jgi:hypothetical protein